MDGDLRDIIDVIKLRKGGLTEFIQNHLRAEIPHVTQEEWDALQIVRKMAEK